MSGRLSDRDLIAKLPDLSGEPLGYPSAIPFNEMVGTKLPVAHAVPEDVVGRCENRSGDRHHRLHRPASRPEAEKLRLRCAEGSWRLTWGSAPHPGSVACGDCNAPRRSLAGARVRAQPVTPLPVWIFHGGADPVVPVSESRQMNEALKTAGGNVRYTEYERVGHNSWDRAYAEPDFFTWLLSQRRGE